MPTRYSIRRLSIRHLDRILEIERASFGEDAYDRNLFAEYLDTCGDLFLGAWRGRALCGYMLTAKKPDDPRAELVSVAVAPAFRGRGVARALMDSTIRRLRRRGATRFRLMVKVTNLAARRLYESYGFTRPRLVKAYYEDGADGVSLTKTV